jgi:hypothetical protein
MVSVVVMGQPVMPAAVAWQAASLKLLDQVSMSVLPDSLKF